MLTIQSIDAYASSLQVRGCSDETVRAYRRDVSTARSAVEASGIDPASLTWSEVESACAAHLTANRSAWSARTVQRHCAALRGWARFVGQPSFLADYRLPKTTAAVPHPIAEGIDGVKAMIASTRNPQHKALCALTGLMGLRVGEAITVRTSDVNRAEMTMTVRGKGDKTRVIPISDAAWSHIEKQYVARSSHVDNRIVPMSNRGARHAIKRHGRNAGLAGSIASHDMRSTFATSAYDKSLDLRAVQELLGHSDPRTTQGYTRVSMDAMRSAAAVA